MSGIHTVYRLARLSQRERRSEDADQTLAMAEAVLDSEGRVERYIVMIVADRLWAAPDWDIAVRWCAALSHEFLHVVFREMGVDPEGQLDGFCNKFGENGVWSAPPIGLTGLPRAME